MSMRNQRVVVTGGAGFLGSHVVDHLLAVRSQVVVVDDLSSGSLANLSHHEDNPWLIIEQADVRDEAALRRCLRGARFVLHLATRNAHLSMQQPTTVHEVNTTGTLNVLKAAAGAGVERLLYCSSSKVNDAAAGVPSPETIGDVSRLAGEHYSRVFHRSGWLQTVIVRPHNTYGPRSQYQSDRGEVIPRFIQRNLAGQPALIHGDGSQGRDFTYVTETADYLVRLLESPAAAGQTFDVCRGEEVAIKVVARLIGELTGQKKPPIHQPNQLAGIPRRVGDPGLLRRVLGSVPRISLREGLALTVAWFRQQADPAAVALEPVSAQDWHSAPREEWLEAVLARQRSGRAA